MKCTFYRPTNVNLNEYENIIGKMELDLRLLLEDTDELDVYYYVWKLAKAAKPLDSNPEMCFWGMDEPGNMPSDARVDYFYRPTYIATAFLMNALLKNPELENANNVDWEFGDECVNKLFEVLPKAMYGCTGRGFNGHGYQSLDGQLDTMELFLKAGVAEFVKKYPEMCPAFTSLFHDTLSSYEERVKTGNTKGAWGTDYRERLNKVLRMVNE